MKAVVFLGFSFHARKLPKIIDWLSESAIEAALQASGSFEI
jgi:hypothetical protein